MSRLDGLGRVRHGASLRRRTDASQGPSGAGVCMSRNEWPSQPEWGITKRSQRVLCFHSETRSVSVGMPLALADGRARPEEDSTPGGKRRWGNREAPVFRRRAKTFVTLRHYVDFTALEAP
jgi:hypothetical protein